MHICMSDGKMSTKVKVFWFTKLWHGDSYLKMIHIGWFGMLDVFFKTPIYGKF